MTVYVLVSDGCVWEFPTAIGVSPLDLLTDVIETPGDVALFDSPNEHGVVAAGRSRSGLDWVVVPFDLQGTIADDAANARLEEMLQKQCRFIKEAVTEFFEQERAPIVPSDPLGKILRSDAEGLGAGSAEMDEALARFDRASTEFASCKPSEYMDEVEPYARALADAVRTYLQSLS